RRQFPGGRRPAVQLGGGGGAGGGVHRWPLSGSRSRAPASSAGGPGNKTAAAARTGPDPSPATTAGPGTTGARLRTEGRGGPVSVQVPGPEATASRRATRTARRRRRRSRRGSSCSRPGRGRSALGGAPCAVIGSEQRFGTLLAGHRAALDGQPRQEPILPSFGRWRGTAPRGRLLPRPAAGGRPGRLDLFGAGDRHAAALLLDQRP